MARNKSKRRSKRTSSRKKTFKLFGIKFSNPFITFFAILLVLFLAANIQTTQNLTAGIQNVLGEGEESEEQKQQEEAAKETVKQQEEAQKESEKQKEEQQKEASKQETSNSGSSNSSGKSSTGTLKTKFESVSSDGTKIKTKSEGSKQETEIETADGQKIRTKIEDDGTTKIEIENGAIKLKYRVENGQIVLKAENEDGEEVEIEDDELEELEDAVDDELEDDDMELALAKDDKLAVVKNQVAAVTDFPLSIDVVTKQLVVTTPQGQKIVTVLPDEAVKNLLATGIINEIQQDKEAQEQLGVLDGVVKLEIRSNEVVYKVNGIKKHRMLGFIPVDSPVAVFVSADTGNTVLKQQSILTNLVDLLSP